MAKESKFLAQYFEGYTAKYILKLATPTEVKGFRQYAFIVTTQAEGLPGDLFQTLPGLPGLPGNYLIKTETEWIPVKAGHAAFYAMLSYPLDYWTKSSMDPYLQGIVKLSLVELFDEKLAHALVKKPLMKSVKISSDRSGYGSLNAVFRYGTQKYTITDEYNPYIDDEPQIKNFKVKLEKLFTPEGISIIDVLGNKISI